MARASVRVEQAQDGGDDDGFLAAGGGAEQVVSVGAFGDADDQAAGGLDGAQSAGLEHRQRVRPQAEAEPSCLCHAATYFGTLMVPSWMPVAMPVSSWA